MPPALLKLEQICPTGWVLLLHCPRDRAQREDRAGAGQGGQGCPDPQLSFIPLCSPQRDGHPRTLLCWPLGTQGLLVWLFLTIPACPPAGNGGIATPAAPRAQGRRCPALLRSARGAQRSRQAALLCRC